MMRLLTSLLLIPFIVYIVLWSPTPAFLAVVGALTLLCLYEFLGIARGHFAALGGFRFGPAPYAAGLLLLVAPAPVWLYAVCATVLVMMLTLRARDLAACLPLAASFALGLLYIAGSWRSAIDLRQVNPYWLLFAVAINWVGDTFAYYGGRLLGRHKLAPVISPNKTWEGAVSSLVFSVALGLFFLLRFLPQLDWPKALLLCLVANIAGQIGDLAESAFKRGAGVKDSGHLLPGHGGWLDRVDSSLFSMPAVSFLLHQPWFGA